MNGSSTVSIDVGGVEVRGLARREAELALPYESIRRVDVAIEIGVVDGLEEGLLVITDQRAAGATP